MLVIPSTPKLWQPRRGAWWRLPRFDALFMAHIKKSASTGHLLKTATGHLTKGCGPCCGDTLADKSVSISSSGIAGACVLLTGSAYGSFKLKSTFSFDGTYTAAWTGIGCVFRAQTAIVGTFPSDQAFAYSSSDCTTGGTDINSDYIGIEINIGSLCEYQVTIKFNFGSGGTISETLFSGSSSAGDAPGGATFSLSAGIVSATPSVTIT